MLATRLTFSALVHGNAVLIATLLRRLPRRRRATGATQAEVRLGPGAVEAEAGVEDGEEDAGDGDHGALEDHERGFVVGEGPVEAAGELGAAEDGADEDGEGGEGEGGEEGAEGGAAVEDGVRGAALLGVGAREEEELEAGGGEDAEGEDLEADTG